jgi:hypothetical protein
VVVTVLALNVLADSIQARRRAQGSNG